MLVHDQHLTGQRRLLYSVRGPEWAFLVPQGRLDCLEDVMGWCSRFWNGVGSLIVPVTKPGRIPRWVDDLLSIRAVEGAWVHPELDTTVAEHVADTRFAAIAEWDQRRVDEDEIPPLHLLAPDALTGLRFEVPMPRSDVDRRLALALWGDLPAESREFWERRTNLVEVEGRAVPTALVRGQVGERPLSPLRVTATGMDLVWQQGWGDDRPWIWVFGPRPTFASIVAFWNFRARSLCRAHGAPVIGVPASALASPELGRLVAEWLSGSLESEPNCYVHVRRTLDDEVSSALAAVPLVERQEATAPAEPSPGSVEPWSFDFRDPTVGGQFERGSPAIEPMLLIDGAAALNLRPPAGFQTRTLGRARLVLHNLPVTLPVTNSVAVAAIGTFGASAQDGLTIPFSPFHDWHWKLTLPKSQEWLEAWASDHGFTAEPSRDGLDASAVLARLRNLDELDVLANETRLQVLEVLAPESRKKLLQRLRREAQQAGVPLDEAALLEGLRAKEMTADLPARKLGDIAQALGHRRSRVMEALSPLVEFGFVRRGREASCPTCRYARFLALDELAEQVHCDACRAVFTLPVAGPDSQEPPMSYRLDGLMARVMDQDVLPVLLALRVFYKAWVDRSLPFTAWPGLLFKAGSEETDVDLLVSYGRNVYCVEVKRTAGSLGPDQLSKLLRIAKQLDSRPAVAALQGGFSGTVESQVTQARGRLLVRDQLMSPDMVFREYASRFGRWRLLAD